MKILYGLAGEGFGHSSRALTIIPFLKSLNHEIHILTYGQAYQVLHKAKIAPITKIQGSHIEFSKGKIDYYKTLAKNLKRNLKNLKNFKSLQNLISSFQPDIIISDMEPLTPILSNLYNLPLISFDNQRRITNLKLQVPAKYYKDYLAAKFIVNLFCRNADHYIITSFTPSQVIKQNSYIVPPIVRPEVLKLKPLDKNFILVYLTKKDSKVINELKNINEKFVVYGYNISHKNNNLHFKTKESFLNDLKNCKAIIASSGFTLMSEALYLKKPYLALPLHGQFEQMLNALFLKQAGFGEFSENLTSKEIEFFLKNLKFYKSKLIKYNPDYNSVFKTLEKSLKIVKSKTF